MIHPEHHYLQIFRIDRPVLGRLVAEALSAGGDYADLYFENTTYSNLVLRDGAVTSGGSHVDFGVGIRVLSSDASGYAYCESTEVKDMLAAARSAAAIGGGQGAEVPPEGTRARWRGTPNPAADRYPSQKPWQSTPASDFLPFLQGLEADIRRRDNRIVKISLSLVWQVSDLVMYNSLDELKYETRPLGSVSATVVYGQKDRLENKTVSRSFRCGAEMLSPELAAEIAAEVTAGVDQAFEARQPKGGKMSVVMAAGASGILLHEAMGHAFEADFNRKGTSVFAGKMGRQVCPKGINILDDGTLKGVRGSLNFDDEGVPGQKTYMVEDGVLTSYLHDRISARHYGVAPTGNGRRESFRYAPLPRMRTTYMESGDARAEDLIASVRSGIFVQDFANGQVQIGKGDFTFYVKSGFLIENGRLTQPVKDVNIIGNGPRALEDIVAVADDLAIDKGAWTCGKEQSVPVSCGIPTVLIRSLTVGGSA